MEHGPRAWAKFREILTALLTEGSDEHAWGGNLHVKRRFNSDVVRCCDLFIAIGVFLGTTLGWQSVR